MSASDELVRAVHLEEYAHCVRLSAMGTQLIHDPVRDRGDRVTAGTEVGAGCVEAGAADPVSPS
jgi:hypothetical protein